MRKVFWSLFFSLFFFLWQCNKEFKSAFCRAKGSEVMLCAWWYLALSRELKFFHLLQSFERRGDAIHFTTGDVHATFPNVRLQRKDNKIASFATRDLCPRRMFGWQTSLQLWVLQPQEHPRCQMGSLQAMSQQYGFIWCTSSKAISEVLGQW